jgi:hypothetical protein
MQFDIFTALNVRILVFWDVMPCNLMDRHQYFLDLSILTLKMEEIGSSKSLYLSTRQNGVTSQRTAILSSYHGLEIILR